MRCKLTIFLQPKMYTLSKKECVFGCKKKPIKMKYSNNYFDNQNQRFKTGLKIGFFYMIIAALFALISNFDEVISYLKTLF